MPFASINAKFLDRRIHCTFSFFSLSIREAGGGDPPPNQQTFSFSIGLAPECCPHPPRPVIVCSQPDSRPPCTRSPADESKWPRCCRTHGHADRPNASWGAGLQGFSGLRISSATRFFFPDSQNITAFRSPNLPAPVAHRSSHSPSKHAVITAAPPDGPPSARPKSWGL